MKSLTLAFALGLATLNGWARDLPELMASGLPSMLNQAHGLVDLVELNNQVVIPQLARLLAGLVPFGLS